MGEEFEDHARPSEWDSSTSLVRFGRLVRSAGLMNSLTRVGSTAFDRVVNPTDRRFGTNTAAVIAEGDIAGEVGGPHGRHSAGYVPIVASAFTDMLRVVAERPSGTFVDLGAGRGRCLILALAHGFERAVGVEHSSTLCESARENLRRCRIAGGEIWDADATEIEFPEDTSLIAMYNPFTPEVWKRVLDGPVAELGRTVTIATHAMPHALSMSSDRVDVRHERTLWVRGRDFEILSVTPRIGISPGVFGVR